MILFEFKGVNNNCMDVRNRVLQARLALDEIEGRELMYET